MVEACKHLGTHVSLRAVSLANVTHRSSSTMKAYVPLAWKLDGAVRVLEAHKLIFARALLFTRLFFGVRVVVLAPKQLKHLNITYMVRLRRVANQPRFTCTDHSDWQIREMLHQPTTECILVRMRLTYSARLVRHRPAALLPLLHCRPGGRPLPWTRQLWEDVELLRPFSPDGFPTFQDGPDNWHDLMMQGQVWKTLVVRIIFFSQPSLVGYSFFPAPLGWVFVLNRAYPKLFAPRFCAGVGYVARVICVCVRHGSRACVRAGARIRVPLWMRLFVLRGIQCPGHQNCATA
ncbi:unnamed protein product [Prorocentrum cordatum]|uniref:Uncharacterized protein n=1 Tax=Prorocentrum cordatum TaxID=2364126 RepID=A0ABN9X8U4_9DINO|nr:unnamed protein product [Polarella glacialis]